MCITLQYKLLFFSLLTTCSSRHAISCVSAVVTGVVVVSIVVTDVVVIPAVVNAVVVVGAVVIRCM